MASPAYNTHTTTIEWWALSIGSQVAADETEVWAVNAPFAGKLVHFEVNAQTSGGTAETCTVDLQQGTTTMLSTPVAIVVGTPTEATLAASPTFAKGAKLSIDLNTGGTSPTYDFISVLIGLERR